ncbi:HET-domain-containing protein [Corynespora cassiicola Philippines]|uniref:HET-domain-containing protein n=1 Tax=Corynespora cassiicola Philippines TaxID=1448308 RepID=A0A2T2NLQ3_CORCC|nr:HET-domain-containing protein [Corynespora cassiicola Philippines]
MRLLDVHTKELHIFLGESIPPYAILSHTWGKDHEEVTFQQLHDVENRSKILGWQKIEYTCNEAARQGLQYAWIDTCCIDKTSSVELSEAINTMFSWYTSAAVCYAYLIDVTEGVDYLSSRWWSRAWTLQELLAPKHLRFYNRSWNFIGSKNDSKNDRTWDISVKTGIAQSVVKDPSAIAIQSIAQKMSWASKRNASRVEDIAYSLLGIFGINMPLLYGEGNSAFIRLQKEILNVTDDQTLFAWGFGFKQNLGPEALKSGSYSYAPVNTDMEVKSSIHGMFAESPDLFKNCRHIVANHQHTIDSHIVVAHGSVIIEMPLLPEVFSDSSFGPDLPTHQVALLACVHMHKPNHLIGILLRSWVEQRRFERIGSAKGVFTFPVHPRDACRASDTRLWIDQNSRILQNYFGLGNQRSIVINFDTESRYGYELWKVSQHDWEWDKGTDILYSLSAYWKATPSSQKPKV